MKNISVVFSLALGSLVEHLFIYKQNFYLAGGANHLASE